MASNILFDFYQLIAEENMIQVFIYGIKLKLQWVRNLVPLRSTKPRRVTTGRWEDKWENNQLDQGDKENCASTLASKRVGKIRDATIKASR